MSKKEAFETWWRYACDFSFWMLSCNTKPCCLRHTKLHMYLLATTVQPWYREAMIARCEAYIDSMTKVSKAPFCTELLEQILGQSKRHSGEIITKHWLGKMRKLKRFHANGFLCWFQKTWAHKSPRAHAGFDPVSMFLRCGQCKSRRLTNHEDGLKKPYAHSWYLYIRFYLNDLSIEYISELNTMYAWKQRLPCVCVWVVGIYRWCAHACECEHLHLATSLKSQSAK